MHFSTTNCLIRICGSAPNACKTNRDRYNNEKSNHLSFSAERTQSSLLTLSSIFALRVYVP